MTLSIYSRRSTVPCTDLNQNLGHEETFLQVATVECVVLIDEQRPRILRHNVIRRSFANAGFHAAHTSESCNDLTKVNAYRSLLQSHSAGQSNFPQMSCTKPRNCLLSDLSRGDGRKSWLIQVAMRSFRVEVSSPRAASAPLLIYNMTVSMQREIIKGTDLFQHVFRVIDVKFCKL